MAGALTSCSIPVFLPLHRRLKASKRFRVSYDIQNPPSVSPPKDFRPSDPKPFNVRPDKSGDLSGASLALLFRLGTGVFAQGFAIFHPN